jgi:predicted enzyme related to lactoylglutathione lyase
MTTRDTNWPEGTPCWVDLGVDDFDKGRAFYAGLLGWEVERGPEEFGGYATCTKDGRAVAGLAPKMAPDQPTVWTVYLASDDLDATLDRVRTNGGQVLGEPMQVGEMGRMALFTDPGGAFTGLWQGASHTGFRLSDEPGAVAWNENYSADWLRNREFYAAVFGWDYDAASFEGTDYAVAQRDGAPVAGIGRIGGFVPEGTPPHWNVYFRVADTDAAIATVRELGGTVLSEPFDSEYGRMGLVADDQGAPFWVMADVPG